MNLKFIEIRSPINEEVVGRVPAMTKEEVDETIKALKELVPMLRRFVRK